MEQELKPGQHAAGLRFSLLFVSRRSRFRQGCRFTMRGADDKGHVANFAETEQALLFDSGATTSFVQVSHWQRDGQEDRLADSRLVAAQLLIHRLIDSLPYPFHIPSNGISSFYRLMPFILQSSNSPFIDSLIRWVIYRQCHQVRGSIPLRWSSPVTLKYAPKVLTGAAGLNRQGNKKAAADEHFNRSAFERHVASLHAQVGLSMNE